MSTESIARGVIAACRARGLGRNAAEAAISTIIAECGAMIIWANDGRSTLNDAYLHRQLNDHERAVARESLNYPYDAVGRNLDSMGLFQQRPMSGWGPPNELMDSEQSTGKFFDGAGGNRGLLRIAGWESMPPWEAGRRVQGTLPKDSYLYSNAYPAAVDIVNQYWGPAVPAEFDILEWISNPNYA